MKSVAFIDQYSTFGGGQTVLLQLIRIFLAKQYSVTVLAPMKGELEARLKAEFGDAILYRNLQELKLTQSKKNLLDYCRVLFSPILLLRHINNLNAHSMVYLNGPRWFWAWWIVNKFLSIRSVYHIHLDHSKIEKMLISKIAKNQKNLVVCISKFVYSRLTQSCPELKDSKNVVVVENGLSSRFSNLQYESRTASKNVAVIGRLSREKGQDLIVNVARLLPSFKFYIIGGADFAGLDFERQLKLEAPSNVIFLGKVSDIAKCLSENNILYSIVPSKWEEPFGLTAIESMAMSCITFVSERGELTNIAKNTGAFIFKNEEELVGLLKSISEDTEPKLGELSFAQYSETLKYYSLERFEESLIKAVFTF